MLKFMVLLSMGVFSIHAADYGPMPRSTVRPGERLWRASVAALAVTNVMDVQSSWGKRELNPLLANGQGRFGREGVLIKLGIQGSVLAAQYLVLRRRPSAAFYRTLALINFGNASVTGSVAVRNYGIPHR
jgi:hypothetical protein